MNPPDFICMKCGGAMEIGTIVDQTAGGKMQSRWLEGEPKESFWAGGLQTDGKEKYKVETYRCQNCGYLESYAIEVDTRKKSIFE
ncbi:MAG TPA: PF20097 family protein [Pyrinomonadaceae bacterium]|jgi:hypothetical protein